MLYSRETLTELPEGWYEHNRIAYILPAHDVKVYRIENRGGGAFGLVRYFVQIAGIEAPVPQSFFEKMIDKFNNIHYVEEYKYIDKNMNTYMVYSSSGKYIKIMPQ